MAFVFQKSVQAVKKESEENARKGALTLISEAAKNSKSVEELRRRLNEHFSLAKSLSILPSSTISPARADTYASALKALDSYAAPALAMQNPEVVISSYRAIAESKGKLAALLVYDWALAKASRQAKKSSGTINLVPVRKAPAAAADKKPQAAAGVKTAQQPSAQAKKPSQSAPHIQVAGKKSSVKGQHQSAPAQERKSGKRYDSINSLVIDYVNVLTKNYRIKYDWGEKIYDLQDLSLRKGSTLRLDCSGFTGTILQTISPYLTAGYSSIPVHSETQYFYFKNLGKPKNRHIYSFKQEDHILNAIDRMDKSHVYVGFRRTKRGKHIGLIVYNENESSWYFIHNRGGIRREKINFSRNKRGQLYAQDQQHKLLARLYVADTHAELSPSSKEQKINEANLLGTFIKLVKYGWEKIRGR